ncbi:MULTISPECIES: glycosyltransferase [Providencia]|uniref:glycosyltransferase n=1 Tax=Providencia TaxID=586 RepID=UPI001CE14F2E|nr:MULTISPECIES: glycosyltransferase [Providencia]ELR5053646.1 glycosyltransferase [Providencia rettgeri]ELR5101742.1 glycosyltransferase [Providencia rettgeri]ELR5181335.1 glycosyltransferase [Providencia rettgeri]ELR5260694.1 glycosyltransferase [Providencia rettgeri]ELR5275327.1 glycosyltransferase [Providencia rettgeri]
MNFSVLLSIYKNENSDFLNQSLLSIMVEQSYIPTEVILVKDGPLTPELDNEIIYWKKKFPHILKVIPLKENVGLGNALNEGLKHCTYDWVFRMDTDDYCDQERFQKQITFIQSHSDIVLLGTCTEEFDISMSKSIGFRIVPSSHQEICNYIKRRNPFNHMTVAFNKEIIQHVGGYQHHLYMEDYNLWIRVISAGYKVANLQDCLVRVRGGDSMVKRRKGITYIKSEFQLAKLKIEKKIDTPLNSYLNFTLRSIPRLLPTSILSKIYKKLRK